MASADALDDDFQLDSSFIGTDEIELEEEQVEPHAIKRSLPTGEDSEDQKKSKKV